MTGKPETGITLSASDMAQELKKTPQAINQKLSDMGLIVKVADVWQLTTTGRARGGIHPFRPWMD
jgi:predicted transcriptional regulator